MKEFIKCPYDSLDEHADCFARSRDSGLRGHCRVLIGDDYKTSCPFYKSVAEYAEGQQKYGGLKGYL